MNLPLFFAKRYLKSKKSHQVINLISYVALSGIAVSVTAMIIVLSAFNGLELSLKDLYNSFDSPVKIIPNSGKYFQASDSLLKKLHQLEFVSDYSRVIEESILLQNGEKATIATIKGVDDSFLNMSKLDTFYYEGDIILHKNNISKAMLGYDLAVKLDFYLNHDILTILAPKKNANIKKYKEAFNEKLMNVSAIFSVAPEYDSKYVIIPYKIASEILEYKNNQCSAIEISSNTLSSENLKKEIQKVIPTNLKVETREEKNQLIYQTNKTEKWLFFSILAFIMLIAAFNMLASLSMLILDKKNDIFMLSSMGANKRMISSIFFAEGILINIIGSLIGLTLGAIIVYIQDHFGLVKLQGMVMDHYPVDFRWSDVSYIILCSSSIGVLASYFPVRFLVKRYF